LCGNIDTPGIGVEEVGEVPGGIFKTCQVFLILYIHHCMKMIHQQTICPRLRDGTDVLPPQIKKVSVIPFLEEDVLVVIAAVINVIEVSIRERRDVGGHR
jgi:hypothetical protein